MEARYNFINDKAWSFTKGVIAIGSLAVTGYVVGMHPNLLKKELVYQPSSAQSSNILVNSFKDLEELGEVLGGVFILKRGLNNIKFALNKKEDALNKLAPTNHSGRSFNKWLSGSVLLTASSLMAGNYFGIAHDVSHTQTSVANFLSNSNGLDKKNNNTKNNQTFFLSSSYQPDILNQTSVPTNGLSDLRKIDQQQHLNVNLIPISKQWVSAKKSGNSSIFELLAVAVPDQLSSLKFHKSCKEIPVEVSNTFGVDINQTFTSDGLQMKVKQLLKNSTGFDLQTLLMNQTEFNHCLNESIEPLPFSFIIANGEKNKVQKLLKLYHIQYPNIDERVHMATAKEFLDNALQTGENAVDGLVLEAIALGFIFADVAFAYKLKNDLARSRQNNLFLRANGFLESDLAKIYNYAVERNVFQSGLFAVPLILVVDSLTNMGEPGAKIGLSLENYLAMLGLTWAVSRVASKIALKQENNKHNFSNGEVL